MKKDNRDIRGWKATSTTLKERNKFENFIAGIPLYLMTFQVLIINLISFCIGVFYNIAVGASITSLLSPSINTIGMIFTLTLLFLLYFSLIFIVTLLYALNNIYVVDFSKYLLLPLTILGIVVSSTIRLAKQSNTPIFFLSVIALHFISFIFTIQAWRGNLRWRWLKDWAISSGTICGTSFYGLDLRNALFDGADLRNTDLRAKSLAYASFVGAKNLELALVKGTILEDKRVRDLLINPRSGEEQDFIGANFQGANLRDANLRGANLTLVNAIDTDFTGAILDEVCIQDWNISKNTKFRGVQCRRVYLKQNKQEPKPDSGEFQEGEFEKWVTEIQDTVDLIFRKGLSLRSLAFAIAQVSIDNEETQLTVESIAHKGDDFVVVKVGKQGNATKEKIHAALTNEYHQAQQAISTGHDLILRAKDDQIEQMRSYIHAQEKHIQGLISCIAQPREPMIVTKIYSTQQGDIMEGQKIQAGGNIEQGNRIIAGGDFTSTGSTTNLGEMEISGQVTNSIQQLQDIQTSDSQELAQILTDLQAAIQDEQNLPPAIKTVSLENVKILSEEAKKEPAQRSKSILEKAVDFLSGIGKIVGDTSKLAEVCKTHLPTLTKLLGF